MRAVKMISDAQFEKNGLSYRTNSYVEGINEGQTDRGYVNFNSVHSQALN